MSRCDILSPASNLREPNDQGIARAFCRQGRVPIFHTLPVIIHADLSSVRQKYLQYFRISYIRYGKSHPKLYYMILNCLKLFLVFLCVCWKNEFHSAIYYKR